MLRHTAFLSTVFLQALNGVREEDEAVAELKTSPTSPISERQAIGHLPHNIGLLFLFNEHFVMLARKNQISAFSPFIRARTSIFSMLSLVLVRLDFCR